MSTLDEINEDWQREGLSPTWAKLQRAKQEQAALIAERDSLRAELERIKALPPVAWEVYVADADNAYVVESLEDPQLIDDCTNSDAVVTPLISLGSKHD